MLQRLAQKTADLKYASDALQNEREHLERSAQTKEVRARLAAIKKSQRNTEQGLRFLGHDPSEPSSPNDRKARPARNNAQQERRPQRIEVRPAAPEEQPSRAPSQQETEHEEKQKFLDAITISKNTQNYTAPKEERLKKLDTAFDTWRIKTGHYKIFLKINNWLFNNWGFHFGGDDYYNDALVPYRNYLKAKKEIARPNFGNVPPSVLSAHNENPPSRQEPVPAPEPIVQPAPEPVAQPAPVPIVQPAPEPVAQPAPVPIVQPSPNARNENAFHAKLTEALNKKFPALGFFGSRNTPNPVKEISYLLETKIRQEMTDRASKQTTPEEKEKYTFDVISFVLNKHSIKKHDAREEIKNALTNSMFMRDEMKQRIKTAFAKVADHINAPSLSHR